jgi:Flp pilus assembly protein TadG
MNPQGVSMRKRTRRVMQREDGQTLVMFMLFAAILIVFVGLGVDLGFAYVTRAKLSKAVDAACLAGIRNLSQGTTQAGLIASNAFAANYGTSGRDKAPPALTINFGTVNGNTVLDVNATVSINTFFIRVMPAVGGANWSTLSVGESAEATRANLIMSLVLDVSGSMGTDGGINGLKTAVPNFVNQFDDSNDQMAMVTFSCGATTPVPMTHPFKSTIKTAVASLSGISWTCAERGLTNGLVQNQNTPITAGENVIKVIVFFTDGLANTWYWSGFNCGPRDMGPDGSTSELYDPNALNSSTGFGCIMPATIPSITPGGTVTTSYKCGTGNHSDGSMYSEAELRAERIAFLARSNSNIVYSIAFSSGYEECPSRPSPNIAFLKNIANTPDSATYDQYQPSGDVAIGTSAADLNDLFQTIAAKILLRLTK